MSKFHSTVTRRDFMKALGFGVAGIGAASAALPVLHDTDEMLQSGEKFITDEPRPWWVKHREIGNPVVEIDFNVLDRFDKSRYNNSSGHISAEKNAARKAAQLELRKAKILADFPGHRLQDIGLNLAGRALRSHSYVTLTDKSKSSGTGAEQLEWSGEVRGVHLGYGTSPFSYYAETPEERGVPKWTGTAEESTHMLRCMARYAGGSQTGFGMIDSQTMKFMWGPDSRYKWTDGIDEVHRSAAGSYPYSIPSKHRYVVAPIIQQNIEGARRGPSNYSGLDVGRGYFQSALANVRLHAWVRTMGYHSTGANGFGSNTAWAVWSGLSEPMRHHESGTPEIGPLFRRSNVFLTDMPVIPTKPIDAGIMRFCETCKKCAEVCPTQAIPHYDEPRWDICDDTESGGDPDNLDPTRFNNPGKKIWWLNHYACMTNWTLTDTGCGMCQGTCVFSRHGVQSVHGLVKTIVATTPILNGFFYNMDDFFGYGPIGYQRHDPDWPAPGQDAQYPEYWAEINSWWDKPRPIYGLNY